MATNRNPYIPLHGYHWIPMTTEDRFEMGEEEYAERLHAYQNFRGFQE